MTADQRSAREAFCAELERLRHSCRDVEGDVRAMTPRVSELPDCEFPEVNANLMLAVRHLENARMRLWMAVSRTGSEGVG